MLEIWQKPAKGKQPQWAQTNKQRENQAIWNTNRQTDRKANIHTNKQTKRQIIRKTRKQYLANEGEIERQAIKQKDRQTERLTQKDR